MLAWSLNAISRASFAAVVVAVPVGHEGEVAELAGSGVQVVTGGATRAESVRAALAAVETEFVAVHDAARPLASPEIFAAVLARLESSPDADGVIAATPLTDTVKRAVDSGLVRATEDRRELWAAQTPQAFRTQKLREAYAADPQRVGAATDEAMLVEYMGGAVLIEPSPPSNLKVTTPDDLRIAELLLATRRNP
jgi:2-C-methyl-D-erythritol 4-phosphate cytidylyltransferase